MNANPIQAGRCTLVGAGPGDPDLLTLGAARAIAEATVLLVDDLVHPDILAHAQPSARIVHVGKRGGCRSTPQAFIHRLMVQAVQAGEQVVVQNGLLLSRELHIARETANASRQLPASAKP